MSNVEFLPTVRKQSNLESWISYNKENNWPDVPAQAKVFAYEFAICGNLTAAAKKIGVGRPRASRLLKDPLVDAFISELQEELADRSIFSREWLELELMEQYEKCSGQVDVPFVTKDGDLIYQPNFQAGASNVALKQIAELTGVSKAVASGGLNINIDIEAFIGESDSSPVSLPVDPVVSEQ